MGASALPSYGPIFEYADSGLTAFRAVENAQGELVDAVVLDANPAQAALSGCERAALRGRHLDAWFPGFDSAVLLGHARACRAAAAPVSFSQSLSDGRTFRGKVYWEGPQTFYLSLDEVRPLAPAGDDLSAVVPAGVLRVNTDGYVVEMMGFFDKLGFNILNAHLARTCQEAGFVDEHGSTVDEESCPVMRCLRDGVGLEEFLRGFPHPDGEMGWLRCSILIANNAKGEREALVTVQDITAEKRWADRLREIVEGVSANVGQRFFQSLVEHLARSLHADFALVGELVNEGPSVRCQAVFADGRQQDPFQYLLKGTPCSEVIAGTLCLFPNGVQQQFPHDTMLADLGVQAYVGVRLEGANGRPLGLIAVMFRR
ncbi:MAG: hypothetical protein JNK87_19530, partial [Bryobacterales bacterium]|nr:hypothetical protein [Bryobacterales bacterium]